MSQSASCYFNFSIAYCIAELSIVCFGFGRAAVGRRLIFFAIIICKGKIICRTVGNTVHLACIFDSICERDIVGTECPVYLITVTLIHIIAHGSGIGARKLQSIVIDGAKTNVFLISVYNAYISLIWCDLYLIIGNISHHSSCGVLYNNVNRAGDQSSDIPCGFIGR